MSVVLTLYGNVVVLANDSNKRTLKNLILIYYDVEFKMVNTKCTYRVKTETMKNIS